jgi:hypothetical protein
MDIKQKLSEGLLSILEDDNKQSKREYLGVSLAGADCNRYIWMKFRFAKKEIFSEKFGKVFRRGHIFEKEFIERLVKVEGVSEIVAIEPEFSEGWIKGHCDAIAIFYGEKILFEIKAVNQSTFLKIQREGLVKANSRYYIQIQLYLHKFGVKKAVFYALNKNTDDDYIETVSYDEKLAMAQMLKLEALVDQKEPPIKLNESPDFFVCKMCEMHGICHKKEPVNITCRTCKNFEFRSEGKYFCKAKDKFISKVIALVDQEGDKSCPKYDMIDGLSDNQSQSDFLVAKEKMEESFGIVEILRRP